MTTQKLSVIQIARKFPDNEVAENWFIKHRWKNGVECTHCNSKRVTERRKAGKRAFRCKDCRKDFSSKTGSLMHDSKIGFREWAIAIFLMAINIKGTSSTKLAHDLGISQKSAWFMAMRIREAYQGDDPILLETAVEVDEAYFGGVEKNKHEDKKLNKGRGAVGKMAVVGIKERETGRLVAKPVSDTSKETLQGFIQDNVKEGTHVYTDESKSYDGLEDNGYEHSTVKHSAGEWVKKQAHTNGIESFWALLRRSYHGTHHWLSAKHLASYVNEFATRSNLRGENTMNFMGHIVREMSGKRLSWKELVARGPVPAG